MPDVKSAALLLFCTAGIYGAYLTQGIVSEHLQMKRFGASQERFGNLEALNGAQSLVCFIWAYALVLLQRHGAGGGSKAAAAEASLPKWHEFWHPALANSIGPALGMIALKNISYPVGAVASQPARHRQPQPARPAALRSTRAMQKQACGSSSSPTQPPHPIMH
jgi:UDP-galactose transporter B1